VEFLYWVEVWKEIDDFRWFWLELVVMMARIGIHANHARQLGF
jgi:hypothetical protein